MRERPGMDGTNAASTDEDMVARTAGMHEEVALRLTLEAMRNGQRAAVGLLALPASLALGVAATVSYAAAFLERGFETFERSLGRIARDAQISSEQRAQERPLFATTPNAGGELGTTTARS